MWADPLTDPGSLDGARGGVICGLEARVDRVLPILEVVEEPPETVKSPRSSAAAMRVAALGWGRRSGLARTQPAGCSPRVEWSLRLLYQLTQLFKAESFRTTVSRPGPFKTIADVEYGTAGAFAAAHPGQAQQPHRTVRRPGRRCREQGATQVGRHLAAPI